MLKLGNDYLVVDVGIESGEGPNGLYSPLSDQIYADRPYRYRLDDELGTPELGEYQVSRESGSIVLDMSWRLGPINLNHRLSMAHYEPYMEETLSLTNTGEEDMYLEKLQTGFVRGIGREGRVHEELSRDVMVSVPFKRALQDRRGEYREFSFRELAINGDSYWFPWGQRHRMDHLSAEGWIWSHDGVCLLVAKHSPTMIEHSVLSCEREEDQEALRFGGSTGIHGDPDQCGFLKSGSSIALSGTRYIVVKGGWKEGYYAFRDFMDSMGHGTPAGFNPPVHWNELYDNPLWWEGDGYKERNQLYTLGHMREEASKARELGCEALYLDPGWDTSFGSSIWPEYRLRKAREFVELMSTEYGLGVSLHMPLAVWCDPTAYPLAAHRRDRRGEMLDSLCSASPAYLETKRRKLLDLAEAGFVYFMFDGTAFTGECWDPSHGHSLPLRRSEHCAAIDELVKSVHSRFPELIIELHDPILGGVPERYAPMHFMHGSDGCFDEGWGFEYMWDPMEDLISGRAISLYYYNLAYSLPLYIHIDLRKDNRNSLEFWWYASTCRHLGVGGKHQDAEVWSAHKKAMSRYLELKRFYTQGVFLGLDEEAHLHFLPGEPRAVLNLFNLSSKATYKKVILDIREIGLDSVEHVSDGQFNLHGRELEIELEMDARDARVIEIGGSARAKD